MDFKSPRFRMATQIGRAMLQGLEAASADANLPVEEEVIQGARNTYVLIRAAKEGLQGMEYHREVTSKGLLKEPEPMLQLMYKRVFDAWKLVRTPLDITGSAPLSRDLDM